MELGGPEIGTRGDLHDGEVGAGGHEAFGGEGLPVIAGLAAERGDLGGGLAQRDVALLRSIKAGTAAGASSRQVMRANAGDDRSGAGCCLASSAQTSSASTRASLALSRRMW